MSGVARVPAPWPLKSRIWTFVLSGLPSKSSFPAGFVDPVEAEALSSGGEFIGGPGMIMVVSYSCTPVGPYDELAYIPGRWKYKDGTTAFRITRIYVSSKESTENGRHNWNIPKSVADFSITTTSNGTTTIQVSLPGATESFFHVKTKAVPILRHLPLPFNTNLLGNYFSLIQPPLPARDKPEEVATTQWASIPAFFNGPGHLTRLYPQINGKVGNGKEFPAVVPWSLGIFADNVIGEFGEPVYFDSK